MIPHNQNYNEWLGHQITRWDPVSVELTLSIRPDHLNTLGIMHGGVLCSLLDIAGGLAGLFHDHQQQAKTERRRAVTISLTTHFIYQSPSQGILKITGQQLGGGRRVYFSTAQILSEENKLLAKGDGTYRYLDS